MHMILDAANDERLAVEVGENATEIAMEFLAQRFVLKKWPAFFRREDQMQRIFASDCATTAMMEEAAHLIQPFQGWLKCVGP